MSTNKFAESGFAYWVPRSQVSPRSVKPPLIDELPAAAVLARNGMPRRNDCKRRGDDERTGDPLRNAQHARAIACTGGFTARGKLDTVRSNRRRSARRTPGI